MVVVNVVVDSDKVSYFAVVVGSEKVVVAFGDC